MRAELLNYLHLRYFWAVVQEGGVTAAAVRLNVTQPTISTQLRKLERSLDGRLLEKRGRTLVPTDLGRLVFDHADRIFALGQDLVDATLRHADEAPVRFTVGSSDVLPKLVVRSALASLLEREAPRIHLVVREGKPEQLLADLAVHRLDLVLADRALGSGTGVRAYNHSLGSSPVGLFGRPRVVARLRDGFPGSLDGAPIMLPTEGAAVRQALERWFQAQGIVPYVVAEFDDSALMKTCGDLGDCVWPGPIALQEAMADLYGAALLAPVADVREDYYAVSLERRVQRPEVRTILSSSPFRT